jgi:16S rRNA (uracil1498-N3)-methyltransferase
MDPDGRDGNSFSHPGGTDLRLCHFLHLNIILFRPAEVQLPLSRSDPRAHHLLGVLRRQPGDTFDAGLINGPRGKGTIVAIEAGRVAMTFVWGAAPPTPPPLTLLVGLPRPQTARDILRDATTLGVAALHFVRTDRGEASYAASALWQSGAWEECVINGAAQAFCTRLPEVSHGRTLAGAIPAAPAGEIRLALDNYEAAVPLIQLAVPAGRAVVVAIGAERGWSAGERALLRERGFTFAHLGERVLRTETACLAAITLLRAKLGLT